MIYTVYHRAAFDGGTTLMWDGDDFGKALKAALDVAGDAPLTPLDHHWVAALHKFPGKPVTAWNLPDEADPEGKAILFITAKDGELE